MQHADVEKEKGGVSFNDTMWTKFHKILLIDLACLCLWNKEGLNVMVIYVCMYGVHMLNVGTYVINSYLSSLRYID